MKKKSFLIIILVLAISIGIVACKKDHHHEHSNLERQEEGEKISSQEEVEEPDHYPVEIDNYEHKIIYEKAPERVIALDYNAASTLVALGLKDKIIATRDAGLLSLEDLAEEYREDVASIEIPKVYQDNPFPPLDANLSLEADFMLMDSFYFNLPDVFGEYKDYIDNDINIYVTTGSQGLEPSIEDMHIDIEALGKIFDVEERAEELSQELRDRLEKVKKKVDKSKNYKLMGFDNGVDKPFVAGGKSLESVLFDLAGGENIFKDVDKQHITVGWEDVIERNPDYIILHETPGDKGAKDLIKILKENKEIADVTAIKEENFIPVPLRYMFSGIYNIDALEIIVDGLYQ